MSDFLISVGIASRNRAFYLEKVFKQVYELGENVQIVISDNSDDNSLEEKLKSYIDGERVRYIYTKERISVVDNYDITAANSSGDYYICIGDDDLVLPNIIDVARWMRSKKIDAAKTSREITYIWPGASSKYGRVSFTKISKQAYKFNSENGVIDVLKKGCQDYIISDMVGSYHALVSMERMNEVKFYTGHYFAGFSPDIYSATCLSLLPDMKCVYLDFPISIPGSCSLSATNRSSKKTAVSRVEEAINNYSNEEYQWSEEIPYYYTPETTWAETMLKAIKAMERDEMLLYFNKNKLVNDIYDRWVNYREDIYLNLTEEEKEMISEQSKGTDSKYSFSKLYKIKRRLCGEVKDIFFVADNSIALNKINRIIEKKIKNIEWNNLIQEDEK